MGDEVTVCDICGDVGLEKKLAICSKCNDGAEHIYCMRVILEEVPEGDWMCEDCMARSECQNSRSPVNLESSSSSKLKLKSSHAKKRQTKGTLLRSGSSKIADINFKGQLEKVGSLRNRKAKKNIAIPNIRKGKNLGLLSKSVPFDNVSSVKLSGTSSEVIQANAFRPVVFKNSSSAEETKAAEGKYVSPIHNPAMCLLASESGVAAAKSENRTISRNETYIAGSNCCRLGAVQSCGHVDCRLQPNSPKAHKDLNCLNVNKKNESWHAEEPAEAATAMKLHELCTHLGSDKKSQFEAATLSEDFTIANPDCIWQGKLQIHRGESIASTCVGIQAHVSTYASKEVLALVDRLPDIIVLEELPRLRMWPSQFMESRDTEENIALYFFAEDLHRTYYRGLIEYMNKNDLALKGNMDGIELLIFPSNVLPEKSQRWNKKLFLWGVFREHMIDNLANTPMANSQKRARSSSDQLSLGGVDNCNSGCSDSRQSLDGKEKTSESVLDLETLEPKSATPEVGPWLSVGNVGDKPNKDVKGKKPVEENNNADNVQLHDKLPMDEKNNAGRPESSRHPSPSLVSSTNYEEILDLPDWQAVETLFFLSKR